MAEGTVTRKEVITDEALQWGPEYAKNVQIAIDKNEELKKSALQLFQLYQQLNNVTSQKGFNQIQNQQIQTTKAATKAYEDQGKALAKVDEERQRSLKSLLATRNRLQNANTSTNKQLIEERENLRLTNREIKANLTAMGRLVFARDQARNSVQEYQAKLALGKRLSDQEQKELEESTKKYEHLNAAVTKIKTNTNQFQENVGNYPKQFKLIGSSIKSLLPGLGVLGGLKLAWDFTKEARQAAIEAKGVEFAFKRLGDEGEDAFNRIKESTRGALSDLDIKTALVDFDNFNLSLEETDTLFEFLAVRAAQTGKSVDELQSSLVEGLSKESKLRIDNLGISAGELNKELEKTPDFVQAVANIAKREVAEAGNILDEAGNAQQRWNADLENFKLLVGNGAVSTFSNALYEAGSNMLRLITPTRSMVDEIKKEQTELNVLVGKITDANVTNEERERLLLSLREQYPAFLQFLDQEKTDNESLAIALEEVNQLYIKRIALQSQMEVIEKLLTKAGDEALRQSKAQIAVDTELARVNNDLLGSSIDLTNKSYQERVNAVTQALEANAKFSENQRTGVNIALNDEAKALQKLETLLGKTTSTKIRQNRVNKELTEEQELMNKLEQNLGITLEQINALFAANTAAKKKNKDATTELTDAEKKALEALRKQLEQDRINLKKAQLQADIDAEQRILENEKESIGNRLLANRNFVDKSIELLKFEKQVAIDNAQGRADEIKRIELAFNEDFNALIRQREANTLSIMQAAFEQAKERIEERKRLEEEALNERIRIEQEALKADLDSGLDGDAKLKRIQEYEDAVVAIKRESALQQLEIQQQQIEAELKNPLLRPEYREILEQQLAAIKMAYSDLTTQHAIENAQKEAEALQALADFKSEKIREASNILAETLGIDAGNLERLITGIVDGFDNALEGIQAAFAVVGDVGNAVFQANIDDIDAQLEASENFYDRQYELAEGDSIQQDLIRAEQELKRQELEKKKRKEQEKQAKWNKALKITDITIATALGIMQAYAQLGPFGGSIAAVLVAALGAAQIAVVASQPVPKYQFGTRNHPGGPAEVAEVRPEVIHEPGKEPYVQRKRAVLHLAKGSKVYSSESEYNRIHHAAIMTGIAAQAQNLNDYETALAFDKYSADMIEEMRNNTKAVKALKWAVYVKQNNVDIPHELFRNKQTNWN